LVYKGFGLRKCESSQQRHCIINILAGKHQLFQGLLAKSLELSDDIRVFLAAWMMEVKG
jgi:hypothetical protein